MELNLLKEILKEQPRKKEIQKAVELEQKSMFFTEPYSDISNSNKYRYNFLRKVENRLNNPDSYNTFINNLTFPLKINEFIESIYSKLSNIWQGQNPYYDVNFTNDNIDDYFQYTNITYYKDEVWEEFKTHYNSILIADLPNEQTTDRPEPYHNIIKISNVVDILSIKNDIQHIIFKSENNLVVIDNMSYQVYNYEDEVLGEIKINSPHNLGICPSVWISQLNFNTKSNIVKSNPLSKSLGKIEDLQIIYTLKNILSPYAFYQFIVKYKNSSECDYDDGTYYCNSGYLKAKDEAISQSQNTFIRTKPLQKCPSCNKQPGVGDVLQKPIPMSSDEPDLKDVISFVAPNEGILKYGDAYIIELENDLFNCIVGTDENLNPNQNHNQMAYKYNIEGQQDVIFRWKSMFEKVISKSIDNILKLRYDNEYISNTIDLGTDFILSDLQSLYIEKEKLDNLGLSEVFNINESIINAKFHNNPEKKRRALIIERLKPFDSNIKEIEESFKNGHISKKDYIKIKYLKEFVKWFETEKININQFSKDEPINKIVKVIDTYYDEWYNKKIIENENN